MKTIYVVPFILCILIVGQSKCDIVSHLSNDDEQEIEKTDSFSTVKMVEAHSSQNFIFEDKRVQFDSGSIPWFINTIPSSSIHFNITNNNTICVMLQGHFSFSVNYLTTKLDTNTVEIHLPKISDPYVKVDGSCVANEGQWIQIMWGNYLPKSSMKFSFNTSDNEISWELLKIEAVIYMDSNIFINTTIPEQILEINFDMNLNPFEVPHNRSYKCFSKIVNRNSTTYLDRFVYPYPVYLTMETVQMQAYNEEAFVSQFSREKYCHLDRKADVLPTIVGSVLLIVITLTLLSHFCWPHSNRHVYERI